MFGEPQLVLGREFVQCFDGNMEFQDKPYYISGILVLSRRVDYRHYGYGGHITDVIVDDELEVFDVDEGEVPGVEITVRV